MILVNPMTSVPSNQPLQFKYNQQLCFMRRHRQKYCNPCLLHASFKAPTAADPQPSNITQSECAPSSCYTGYKPRGCLKGAKTMGTLSPAVKLLMTLDIL